MRYTVLVKRSAKKEILNLPGHVRRSVEEELVKLEDEPRPTGRFKVLKPPLEGYRIRVGDWRVLYVVDDLKREVFVYSVSHRGEAYR